MNTELYRSFEGIRNEGAVKSISRLPMTRTITISDRLCSLLTFYNVKREKLIMTDENVR